MMLLCSYKPRSPMTRLKLNNPWDFWIPSNKKVQISYKFYWKLNKYNYKTINNMTNLSSGYWGMS